MMSCIRHLKNAPSIKKPNFASNWTADTNFVALDIIVIVYFAVVAKA